MTSKTYTSAPPYATGNEPYEAIICGGLMGIAATLYLEPAQGKLPHKMAKRLRRRLDAGYCIRVVTKDQATWQAVKPRITVSLDLNSLVSL